VLATHVFASASTAAKENIEQRTKLVVMEIFMIHNASNSTNNTFF
jgi:hypothetical protein